MVFLRLKDILRNIYIFSVDLQCLLSFNLDPLFFASPHYAGCSAKVAPPKFF